MKIGAFRRFKRVHGYEGRCGTHPCPRRTSTETCQSATSHALSTSILGRGEPLGKSHSTRGAAIGGRLSRYIALL